MMIEVRECLLMKQEVIHGFVLETFLILKRKTIFKENLKECYFW